MSLTADGKTSSDRTYAKGETTAYHEAGHAVLFVHFKRPFRSVTIVSEGDSLGHVAGLRFGKRFRPDLEVSPQVGATLDRILLILMAGNSAERRLTGRRNNRKAGGDFEMAVGLGGHVYPEPEVLGSYLDFVIARSDSLIGSPVIWAQVEAVAAELLLHRSLSSERVRDICTATIEEGTRVAQLMDEEMATELAALRSQRG